MFMFITYPWPVPSANVEGLVPLPPIAATHIPDVTVETTAIRSAEVEELVCWTRQERLRLLWYRLRLAPITRHRGSRRTQKPRLRLP